MLAGLLNDAASSAPMSTPQQNTTSYEDDQLPPGWVELEDPATHSLYYYNNNTFESRWERPVLPSAQRGLPYQPQTPITSTSMNPVATPNTNYTQNASPSARFQHSARSVQSEWDELFDPASNLPYYINKKTHVTQWEKPPSLQNNNGTPYRT